MDSFRHTPRIITYSFEYERRLRACFIGAGGHAFRNVFPALRYTPVDLAAVCDLNSDRGRDFARMFGAERSYAKVAEMLAAEKPELVFIVTAYAPDGRVQATDLAAQAMRAGAHVWMEKPTAATSADVRMLQACAEETGRLLMTGLKKTFFPTIEKLKELIGRPDFGRLTSISVRYPQRLPPLEDRRDPNKMQDVIDHIYHPGSILDFLAGPVERASYEWDETSGATVTSFKFTSGAVGTLHLTAGQSGGSVFERVEVVGEGANAIVENGTRLTFYRRADLPAYGRASSFIQPEDAAALLFEPEHSLGQLYNNNLFYLGYVGEILHLTDAILEGAPLTRGTLDASRRIMRLFDFYRDTPAGQPVRFVNEGE